MSADTLFSILIDDIQNSDRPTISRSSGHKILRPNVIGIFRTKANTGTVIKQESPTLELLLRNLKTFGSPDSVNSIMTHIKTIFIKKPCHFSITVTSKKLYKIDDSLSELFVEWVDLRFISLSTAIESNHFAGPTCGNVELIHDMSNGFFLASRA
jgi:hypothetical protein